MTDDLISRVVEELCDPLYHGRTHGRRTTHKEGCKGPLCLKAERDRSNRRRQKANPDRKPRPQMRDVDEFLTQVINGLGLHPRNQGQGFADEDSARRHVVQASQHQAA